ncbi:MAG TPA: phage holin family protein [Bacillota bacterium]
MNWTRLIIRFVSAFLVLFLLGYLIGGFSGFTYLHLTVTAFLTALISALADLALKPHTAWERSLILFLTSAVAVYFYAMLVGKMRTPLSGTALAAALIGLVDLVFPERLSTQAEKEERPPEN